LLQHVSVYKETIIRGPQSLLSWNYTLGSKWVRRARTRRCQCYGCILWPVRRVYCALCEGILCTVQGMQYTLTQCTVHTPRRSQYTAITLTTSCTSSTYPLWTKCVIFAKYWLWLPDDGLLVNRNMLEQFSLFENVLITLRFLTRERWRGGYLTPQEFIFQQLSYFLEL